MTYIELSVSTKQLPLEDGLAGLNKLTEEPGMDGRSSGGRAK